MIKSNDACRPLQLSTRVHHLYNTKQPAVGPFPLLYAHLQANIDLIRTYHSRPIYNCLKISTQCVLVA
jgi:hypothetical protein